MGFYLRCAIARVEDGVLAARIADAMKALFPPFVNVRRFDAPFAGVIAGYDPVKTHEKVEDDLAAYGYADEETAYEEVAGAIDDRLGALSREFPDLPFAFVDADCFGGVCRYYGFIIQNGDRTHVEDSSSNAHVALFAKLGVAKPQWHFAPFTRGFMATGVASDLDRLPTTYYVQARWDEPFRLAAMRAAMLPAPWRITIMTETSCIAAYGEQFVASLHSVDDQVELRGQSFVDRTLTTTLAHELADDEIALELKDPDGKPL